MNKYRVAFVWGLMLLGRSAIAPTGTEAWVPSTLMATGRSTVWSYTANEGKLTTDGP